MHVKVSGAKLFAACLSGFLPVLFLAGCGNSYRPVVSAINPVGPAGQPQKYAVAISDPGNGRQGIVTVVDFSGDTLIANANIAPAPVYFDMSGSNAFVLHRGAGSVNGVPQNSELIDTFTASSTLLTDTVRQTSLLIGSNPTRIFAGSATLYVTEPGTNRVAALTGAQPPVQLQEIGVPANPVYTVGRGNSARVYVLSQGATPGTCAAGSTGIATAIDNNAGQTVSNSIPLGCAPVFGLMNADTRRAFVLNQGGTPSSGGNGTVSVINTQTNALDNGVLLPGGTINVGQAPVWADTADSINELAVLNQGNGTGPGSLSIINIPLCNTVALPGNTSCDAQNPSDAAGFGQVLATLPVGTRPVMVTVVQDRNKAYVANSDGTVTVIDLKTQVVVKTIAVGGTLNWIVSTSGTQAAGGASIAPGKVYVTASNTQNLTVIGTDTDSILATIPLQGVGVAVRVTQQ